VKKFIAIILIIIGIAVAFGSFIQASVEKGIVGHSINLGALWTVGIIGVIILIGGIIMINRK